MESVQNILSQHPFLSGLNQYFTIPEKMAGFQHIEAHRQIFENGAILLQRLQVTRQQLTASY